MSGALFDPSTPFGKRVEERLRADRIIWITTVSADGTPQPNPVWFLWEAGRVLIYTMPSAARLKHIQRNPRVALNFDSRDSGNDVVIFTGDARIAPDAPLLLNNPAFLAKYQDEIARMSDTWEQMASEYSVGMEVTPTKARGF